jgi:hypothetical protein
LFFTHPRSALPVITRPIIFCDTEPWGFGLKPFPSTRMLLSIDLDSARVLIDVARRQANETLDTQVMKCFP